ncbi:MAG: hypothetical protein ACR2P2_09000 [Nakamurella sp.]
MDVDTEAVRFVGAELGIIALGWIGTGGLGEVVPQSSSAFGTSPEGAELGLGLANFGRRAQDTLRELSSRADAAGNALLSAAAGFEQAEAALGMGPA